MKRRTILAGLGASALGGSALLGSGAFSRVDAQRDVTVQVATDENAYLGMKPLDTPNSNNFVELDDDGHLTIDVGEHSDAADEGGDVTEPALGVNSDSFTFFDGLFDLCNQGKQEVDIAYDLPEAPDSRAYGDDFIAPDPDYDQQVITFYYISEGGDDPAPEGDRIMIQEGQEVPLPLGECKEIGLRTVTKGVDATDVASLVDGEVVLTADVDGASSPPPAPEGPSLAVDQQITDQCPEDPGVDVDGAGTTFDVTATIENTSDDDASGVEALLDINNPNGTNVEESQSIGTLGANSSTTVTFSGVGSDLDLGGHSSVVTVESDTADAINTLDLDIVDGCPSDVDDGSSSTIDQFCGGSSIGEDEEEKENEDEGSSGGDYIYTYTYDYIYKKGKLRYEYHYQYEYSPSADQDPDPTPPPVDSSLPCSEDGSPSPAPAPSPSPP